MVRVPDATSHRRDFAALPLGDRRAVLRAVNRGQAVENRKLAGHAVVVARRQRKLWIRMPFAGPFVALTQVGLGWQAVVASAIVSTLAMAAISSFWWRRAERAETANLALTADGKRRTKAATDTKAAKGTKPATGTKRAKGVEAAEGAPAAKDAAARRGKRSHTPTRAELRDRDRR